MRLLITGGSSYLGKHLVPLAIKQGHEVGYTFFENRPELPGSPLQLDLRHSQAVKQTFAQWQPEAVIHLAGSNRATDMAAVIVAGTRNVVSNLRPQSRLINLSTDVIFNGLDAPYDESATPTPLHEYGKSKVAAEQIVAKHSNHVTVRTSLIYGLTLKDRGTEGFQTRLAAGDKLTLFNNQYRNPVWVQSLCEACLELLTHSHRGLLHVAGSETLDRASYSMALLDFWGVTSKGQLTVGPDESGRFPPNTRLDISLARSILKTALPGFHDVLIRHKIPTE